MEMSLSSLPLYLSLSIVVFMLSPLPSLVADPDALQDLCVADLKSPLLVNGYPCKPKAKVTSNDFFYDGLIKEGSTNNPFGSNATIANVEAFPGLNTLGVSMNRVDFAPGGINPPHIHPRASEITVLIKGELLVGFVTTDHNNVYYSKVIRAGEVFVIPKGLVHFQKNVGKGHAYFFAAFNSQLPGVGFLPQTLFAPTPPIPNHVLTKAFQTNDDVINSIKANLTLLKIRSFSTDFYDGFVSIANIQKY